MSLFIPPEGAMQFHCTFDAFHRKDVDIQLWVLPSVPRRNYMIDCDCKRVYPVLIESITEDAKKQGAENTTRPHVCDCCGRLIE